MYNSCMDDLNSLFEKKQYELIIDLTKSSNDPKERFMRLSCFIMLGKDDLALKEIDEKRELFETHFPQKLMKLHFEILLKNKMFDEAKIMLKHYQELPYISQNVEEFLRDMPKRIEDEEHHKEKYFSIDEICEILEKETDNGVISEVVFSLKKYNLNTYIDSLRIFLTRKEVNPNFRTYGLILLVDNKYDEDVMFLSKDGLLKINPNKITPPFTSPAFNKITELVFKLSERNVTLQETALHLVNCLVMDVYPNDINFDTNENMAQAFIALGSDYIKQNYETLSPNIEKLKQKIKDIIESTPPIMI